MRRSQLPIALALGLIAATTGAAQRHPNPSERPAPTVAFADAGSAALHIPDAVYYQGNYQNLHVDPNWLAAHYTLTEQGGDDSYAVRFLQAGGRWAIRYTDPTLVPKCTWPAPYQCAGPIGKEVRDESAWLHAPDGTRLHVVSDGAKPQGAFQEHLNPASPDVQRAFAREIGSYRGNGIFADDTAGTVDRPVAPGARRFVDYKYGTAPAEYCPSGDCSSGDRQYLRDTAALLGASRLPVFVNGAFPATLELMSVAKNVVGAMSENCYRAGSNELEWTKTQNFILAANRMGKYSLCLYRPGSDPARDRGFALASDWLVNDGARTLLWAEYDLPTGENGLLPEFGVVPSEPRATAESSIDSLRVGPGLYVREFSRCAQDGRWVGPCAAVVNAGGFPLPMPRLQGSYKSSLDFSSAQSWSRGATARWRDGIPSFLMPHTGVTLR